MKLSTEPQLDNAEAYKTSKGSGQPTTEIPNKTSPDTSTITPIGDEREERQPPFTDFLYRLREEGVQASTAEWLDLQRLIDAGVVSGIDDMYAAGRATLVKEVTGYATYDRVFGEVFFGIEQEDKEDPYAEEVERYYDEHGITLEEITEIFNNYEGDYIDTEERERRSYRFEVRPGKEGYYVTSRTAEFDPHSLEWRSSNPSYTYAPDIDFGVTPVVIIKGDYNYYASNIGVPVLDGHSVVLIDGPDGLNLRQTETGEYLVDRFRKQGIPGREPIMLGIAPERGSYSRVRPTSGDTSTIGGMGVNDELASVVESLQGLPVEEYCEKLTDHIRTTRDYPPGTTQKARQYNALMLQKAIINSAMEDPEETDQAYIGRLSESKYLECLSANTLFVALCREEGIPARMVFGNYVHESGRNHVILEPQNGHAWAEVWNGNEWLRFDATPAARLNELGITYPNAKGKIISQEQPGEKKPEMKESKEKAKPDPKEKPEEDQEQKPKKAAKQKEKEHITEVAKATSKTSQDIHGGDEATKDIKDSPNKADEGEKQAGIDSKDKAEGPGSTKQRILEARFNEFDDDTILTDRHFERALAKLKGIVAEHSPNKAPKLNAKATAEAIAKNGGFPELVWSQERDAKPNVVLMFDVGGSTDEVRPMVERLFRSAKGLWGELDVYYFHNIILGGVWPQKDGNYPKNFISVREVLRRDPSTKIVIIGDAQMGYRESYGGLHDTHQDIYPDSYDPRDPYHKKTGLQNIEAIDDHFDNVVWLWVPPWGATGTRDHLIQTQLDNQLDYFGEVEGSTIQDLQDAVSMHDLTLRGLENAVRELMR